MPPEALKFLYDARAVWETASRSLPDLVAVLDRLLSDQGACRVPSMPHRAADSPRGRRRSLRQRIPDTREAKSGEISRVDRGHLVHAVM